MLRIKIPILLIILLIFSLLNGETMVIQKQNETLTFDTAEIQEITFDITSVDEYEEIFNKIPIKLMQNYPNPFNVKSNQTAIEFSLKQQGKTEVSIYNIKGQRVKTLVNESLNSGDHKLIWDGNNSAGKEVCSGIYFYKIEQDGKTQTKKMIVIR